MSESATTEQDAPAAIAPAAAGGSGVARAWPADRAARVYAAIDLKSFYASVECRERGLDPLDALLVVADESRSDKTICLAASPSLKALGVSSRGRLYEAWQRVAAVNAVRRRAAPGGRFTGSSFLASELAAHPELAVDFIIAEPRMSLYLEYSARVLSVYGRYTSPDDIAVYSVDEAFLDLTPYRLLYGGTPRTLTARIIRGVLAETGITATAGIGTNLYLSKVAMDIVAKHLPADADGVRIAELDELEYRRTLWTHRPLTDFWRVGPGTAARLEAHGLYTMGDVARQSLRGPGFLYRLFGKNAELLIDHAWGWEPCTIAAVHAYRPANRSVGTGQLLPRAYSWTEARLAVCEMAEQLALELVRRQVVTANLTLTVSYDTLSREEAQTLAATGHALAIDGYGRLKPRHDHGSLTLPVPTASARQLLAAAGALYDRVTERAFRLRRLNLTAGPVLSVTDAASRAPVPRQLDLFEDNEALEREQARNQAAEMRDRSLQLALLRIKRQYGKNAILRGMNFEEGARMRERNTQIGGHKA